jgi:cobalt/nickel transport system permease protein
MIFYLIKISKIPIFKVLKRATIEIPFIFFAILMPFISGVKDLDLGLISISSEGAYAGGSIIVKATAGTLISVLLGATTTVRSLLRGFTKLRMPSLLVQIATFMLRYVNVISAESERMEVARQSRGFIATGPKHWKVLAQAAGTLFIRSYERGERVHLAMLSRGYVGNLPDFEPETVHKRDLTRAILLPTIFLITAIINFVF